MSTQFTERSERKLFVRIYPGFGVFCIYKHAGRDKIISRPALQTRDALWCTSGLRTAGLECSRWNQRLPAGRQEVSEHKLFARIK